MTKQFFDIFNKAKKELNPQQFHFWVVSAYGKMSLAICDSPMQRICVEQLKESIEKEKLKKLARCILCDAEMSERGK